MMKPIFALLWHTSKSFLDKKLEKLESISKYSLLEAVSNPPAYAVELPGDKIQSQKLSILVHLKDQYLTRQHKKLGRFCKRMILRLPTDTPEDVSAGISTLTVYVPDQTHLKLKAKISTLYLEFG